VAGARAGRAEAFMDMLTLPRSEPTGRTETVSSHRTAVERVIRGMRQRIDVPLSLQGMAALAHLSPFHFDRVFRDITGIPPKAFFSALRLLAAKRLLAETSRSVTDVCFDLGYSSLGSFVARFGKVVGLSPIHWRRAVRSVLALPATSSETRTAEPTKGRAEVVVDILAPPEFSGVIFAGLFAKPCPQGRPVACAIAHGSATVRLEGVPDGLYYLCVAGVSHPLLLAHEDQMLRGGGARNPVLVRHGVVSGPTSVRLRAKEPTDPPILVGIPFITRRTASRRETHGIRMPHVAAADRDTARRTP
jgi:AraC-like DNA-binding protein